MGIKHFFGWFTNNFGDSIYKIKKGETIASSCIEVGTSDKPITAVDNFMIDMNGIYHEIAQIVFEYGNGKRDPRMLGRNRPFQGGYLQKQQRMFEKVCEKVEYLFNIVQPKKRLILCVDGPAPLSKQNQQRQRRFRTAMDKAESEKDEIKKFGRVRNKCIFDSNSITPGTKMMDCMSKYIEWWIKHKLSTDSNWKHIEVVFSDEKVPGEGEHLILNYVRKYGDCTESFCIQGMDADLIMLSLGTHFPHFYILRDNLYELGFEYYFIDIGSARKQLAEKMVWNGVKSGHVFDPERAVNDFIFICFTVGNDFLPHIPGIEIIEGGIDFMLDVYKNVCTAYGHLTRNKGVCGIRFRKKSTKIFMGTIAQYVKGTLEDKLGHKGKFFPDPILESATTLEYKKGESRYTLDMEKYKNAYYTECFPDVDLTNEATMQKLCDDYFEGMQWVLSYYTNGVPNWKWKFPHHYAPFASTLAKYINGFKFVKYGMTQPNIPFVQLLSVLPPLSSRLLPEPLAKLLTDKTSELYRFCPDEIKIDLAGKRRAWEGIVLLPHPDHEAIEAIYMAHMKDIDTNDMKRNHLGKSYTYSYSPRASYYLRSRHGDFRCTVQRNEIDI